MTDLSFRLTDRQNSLYFLTLYLHRLYISDIFEIYIGIPKTRHFRHKIIYCNEFIANTGENSITFTITMFWSQGQHSQNYTEAGQKVNT